MGEDGRAVAFDMLVEPDAGAMQKAVEERRLAEAMAGYVGWLAKQENSFRARERHALLDLNGSRWREAKLFPSCGVKLPCLSARSQSFVDVIFGSI